MSRGEKFINRLGVIGQDLLQQGQDFLQTGEQIIRGIGSNIKRFGSGLSNAILSSLNAGQSVGSIGDAFDKLSQGDFSGSWQQTKNAISSGFKSGLQGTSSGFQLSGAALTPALLSGAALAGWGLLKRAKNSNLYQNFVQKNFDSLSQSVLSSLQSVAAKGYQKMKEGTSFIADKSNEAYSNYKKSKQTQVPMTVGQAQILDFAPGMKKQKKIRRIKRKKT